MLTMASNYDNIQVAIRIRPLLRSEIQKNLPIHWGVQDNNIYQIDSSGQRNGELYSFDHIFEMSKTNTEIYDDIVKEFVDSSLNGLNSTIFAYGQTSSGKTFTMFGSEDDKGIIPLAVDRIFDSISKAHDRKYLLRASYVEIYNERINDLLDTANKDIKIREYFSGMIALQTVKEEIVSNREQVYDLLRKGATKRHIGATNMNDRSSRSHTIFKIVIESAKICDFDDKDLPVQISTLNLVDLAGSERVAQTKATGMRLKEGGHINKSLSALGLVIRQLSDGQEFINFRDSKLTRLLQHSLGGNAKTLIIATITLTSLEDTNSTLSFAQRAKAVKNKPRINEITSDSATCKRYAEMNAQLKERLEEQLLVNKQLEDTKEENSKEILRLQEQMHMLEVFLHGKVNDSIVVIPKRRHTICHTGRKIPLRLIAEESEEDMSNIEPWTPAKQDMFKPDIEFANKNNFENLEIIQIDKSECSTPQNNLRDRIQGLQQAHDELITRDEQNILEETSEKVKELEKQLEREIQKNFEMKCRKKLDDEMTVIQLNKLKARETELMDQIALLECQLKDRTFPENINFDFNSELQYLRDQLTALHNILADSRGSEDSENHSVQQIIENFNSKIKTAKEMIECEIWKQMKCFTDVSEQLNNEPLVLPNELESFKCVLNELCNFEKEIPPELISDNKTENLQNVTNLNKIYESFLQKNDLIGRFSEKVMSLQEQVKTTNERYNKQINELQASVNRLELEINEKLKIEHNFETLKEELNKVYHNLINKEVISEELVDYGQVLNKITEEIRERATATSEMAANLKNIQLENQFANEQLTELKQTISTLNGEIDDKNMKLKTLSDSLAAKNSVICKLEKTITTLKEDNDQVETACSDYCDEIVALKDSLHRRDSIINEQTIENAKTKTELYKAQCSIPFVCYFENEELRGEMTKTRQAIQSYESEITRSHQILEYWKNRVNILEDERLRYDLQVKEFLKLQEKLQVELETQKRLYNSAQAHIKTLKETVDELKCDKQVQELIPPSTECDREKLQEWVINKSKEMFRHKCTALIAEKDYLDSKLKQYEEENYRLSCTLEHSHLNVSCSQNEKIKELTEANNALLINVKSLEDSIYNISVAVGEYESRPEDDDSAEYNASLRKIAQELSSSNDSDIKTKDLKDEIDRLNNVILANKETIDKLTTYIDEYKAKCTEGDEALAVLRETNDNYVAKIKTLEEQIKELKPYEEKAEQLKCDIIRLRNEFDENVKMLEEFKELNKNLKKKIEMLQIKHEAEISEYVKKLKENEDEYKQQTELFQVKNSNLRLTIGKLEAVVCNIIEQFIKEEKTLLTTKLTQQQRDSLKNVRKDLKEISMNLKSQLQLLQNKSGYDLDKINELLIKSNDILKQYLYIEKKYLQSCIDELDLANKAYIHEISALKEFNKNGCPNCTLMKNEVADLLNQINSKEMKLTETLSKLRDSQEKLLATGRPEQGSQNNNVLCCSCVELNQKYLALDKKHKETMSELVGVRVQAFRSDRETAETRRSDLLDMYVEENKKLCKKVKEYEAAAKVATNSVDIQCDLGSDDRLRQKYEKLKELFILRKREIETLKKQLDQC